MKTALIIIDIQNDYFPNGRMETEGSIEAGRRAGKALAHFREAGLPVFFIQHVSMRPNAGFLLPDTDGVEIHESVKPLPDEVVIRKHFPNSFRGTPLLERLKAEAIGRPVICGMMTHMCVDATVRAAFDYGFECIVLGDACATRSLTYQDKAVPAEHVHAAFLAALDAVYAKVETVDGFLARME